MRGQHCYCNVLLLAWAVIMATGEALPGRTLPAMQQSHIQAVQHAMSSMQLPWQRWQQHRQRHSAKHGQLLLPRRLLQHHGNQQTAPGQINLDRKMLFVLQHIAPTRSLLQSHRWVEPQYMDDEKVQAMNQNKGGIPGANNYYFRYLAGTARPVKKNAGSPMAYKEYCATANWATACAGSNEETPITKLPPLPASGWVEPYVFEEHNK